MSRNLDCSFNRDVLAKTTILYIEDEDTIRTEVSEIFQGFFKNIIVARDGVEGLELFKKHQKSIDIILTDINMPRMNGLELLANIREINWDIPILIVTAFKETDILLKVIKFNVANYILKPMQLNTTLKIISQIIENIQMKKELARSEFELKQFMSILDSKNLICEIDANFKITHANDSFLLISGYTLDELIGKDFSDMKDISSYNEMIDNIKSTIHDGKVWNGDFKKKSKNDVPYYTNSTIMPIFNADGSIKRFIEFATLTTKYENEILSLKKHIMVLKSESFKTNTELKNENNMYIKLAEKLQKQVDDTVNNSQQLLFETYEIKKRNAYLEEKFKEQEKRIEKYLASSMHVKEE